MEQANDIKISKGDLISRSALLAEVPKWFPATDFVTGEMYRGIRAASKGIQEAPAVDAVELVRCKDCEAWQTETAMSFLRDGVHVRCCVCGVYGRLMYEDDFCSKGKRR